MTTLTYSPLIGVTCQCDPNNRISYYEYDGLNRLMLVRDQDKNILKQLCYNYAGQPENCSIYYNVSKSGIFTRNNNTCSTGYFGSSVSYTVPPGTYSANSQAIADQQATDDVNANGQAYANANGTCIAGITVNGYDTYNYNYNVKFTNNSGGAIYTFVLPHNSYSPQFFGYVPSGTYSVQFWPQSMPLTATFNINGLTYTGTGGTTFYNVNISSTSTASMY
jgi:hypothetical protein